MQTWCVRDTIDLSKQLKEDLIAHAAKKNYPDVDPTEFDDLVGVPLRFYMNRIANELCLEEKPYRKDIFKDRKWLRMVVVSVSSRPALAPQLVFLNLLRDNGDIVSTHMCLSDLLQHHNACFALLIPLLSATIV